MSSSDTPFLPYGRQCVEDDDVAAVVSALRSDYLTTGPRVAEFEEALAAALQARFAVAVATGTAALHAAYFAAGLGAGDDVVVPAMTFLATANAALYLSAKPVFADVDADSGLLTLSDLERAWTPRTRAVVPVHLTGMPVDLKPISEFARSRGAVVIEDAAHALGARYHDRPIGAGDWSDMTVLSFHPVKHITSGEGGAVLTNDAELYKRLRQFRNHGMVHDGASLRRESPGPWYYEQQALGFNYRITDLQCALGTSQLAKLDRFVKRRRELAHIYDQRLASVASVTPVAPSHQDRLSAYHLYSVLVDFDRLGCTRADVMNRLRSGGIGSQVHYIPVPAQPFYEDRGYDPSAFPGANAYYARTLSLPLYPTLSDQDVERVVHSLQHALKR